MFRKLLLVFIIVPVFEILLFIFVGKYIGFPFTLLILFLTSLLGAYLSKKQGLRVLHEIQEDLQMARAPALSGVEGLCILIGSVLLLTPGFFTDICGVLLFIPFTRRKAAKIILAYFRKKIRRGNVSFFFKK